MAAGGADATSTYAIDLEDGTSGPAESAAKALANLKRRLDSDTKALAEMNKAMRNLKLSATPNLAAIKSLNDQIGAQRGKIADAQNAFLSLGGTFSSVGRKPKPTTDALAELAKQAQGMPGPIGGVVSRLGNLKAMFAGNVMRLAIVGVAAALVALAAAAIVAMVALAKYGVAAANARRNEILHLEGLTKMRNYWGVAAGSATEMQGAIDRVSGSSALGRDKIAQYAGELYKLNLRGKNLEYALDAAATKGAVLGDEGAKSAMQWAAGMNMAGKSVKALSDDVKARFGGVAAAQMLSLEVQSAKLSESFSALFAALKIEPLLKGISAATSLFSQSTRSGQALKAILTTVFQPVVDAVAYVAPIVKRFFQGIIIGGLLVGIALLSIRRVWRRVFGGGEVDQTYLMRAALIAGGVAAGVLAAGLAVVIAPLALFGMLAYRAAQAFTFVWKWVGKGYDLIKSIKWGELGRSIVAGIVGGLKGAAKWLVSSVEELGSKALGALKSKLGIASPSRAFLRLGVAIPQGVEAGVEAGTPGAQNAVRRMVDAPSIPDAPAPRGAAGPGAGGGPRGAPQSNVFNIGGVHITSTADKPAELVADIEQAVTQIFERIAIQLGAPLPRGGAA